MDRCDLAAFLDHAFCVNGGSLHLTADRSVYDGCDLSDHLFEISAFLSDQGGVGGNATDHAHVVSLLDVFYLSGVNKKAHTKFSFSKSVL